MGVAKELSYTLTELMQRMTLDELLLWSAYFDLQNDEQELAMKRRR
jgi:hypothetical protein